jgi:tetratricopeptide (TPR) repeat protein
LIEFETAGSVNPKTPKGDRMSRQNIRASANARSKKKASPSNLYDEGFRHFKLGRLAVAEEHFRQALAFDPKHADSLHLLGLIHAQANNLDLAIESIAEAIKSNPNIPDYFSNLGMLLGCQGKFEEALKSYDLALQLKPDFVDIWIKFGDLLQNQKRFDEALLTYDRALTLDPRNAEAASKGGLLLLKLERYQEALARFDLLQAIKPGQGGVFYNRGVCLNYLARWEEAAQSYREALKIDPENHETHNNLGAVLLDLRRFDEAHTHFQSAIRIKPDFVPGLNNLGNRFVESGRFEEAIAVFDQALLQSPDQAELYCNKANALKAGGRLDEALACYDWAIGLKPDYAEAHNNRGTCLEDMMRMGEALFSYRNALALQPDYAEAHWNFALNRLRIGDLKTGWVESEWRWKCRALQLRQRDFGQPLWLGAESIEDKSLLVYRDQGLGDAIQFLRYVPLVAARGARIFLEVDPALHELCSGLPGVSRIIAKGEALPAFDFHCPLSSLPMAFDTTLNTIPQVIPYLSAGANAGAWKERLGAMKRPRVGLVWAGNPNHFNDRNRSVPLETLLPLLDVEAQFFSLQKEARPGDQAVLREHKKILDLAHELPSFAETAAIIQNLDLLISVDTSVAHLAGALGRPVWILLSYVPDWRWQLIRADSPWYPTARLFRQSESRDWQSVVHQVSAALQVFGQYA